MTSQKTEQNYRSLFVGLDAKVPLLDGSQRLYTNLDNAASTPSMKSVLEAVNRFMVYYSSVHRGTGFKSQLCTHAFEDARLTVMHYLGADPKVHTCIFCKNTTEAINKLARRFPFSSERDIVLTSGMEHHSNDLPWRANAHTIHVNLTPDGRLDEADFDAKLHLYRKRLALVAITGASNVTGILNPIHRLAQKTHEAGARIVVDCAQLAPHRKVEMRSMEDPTHLDYVTISGHKMYAPFGTGALIGMRDTFLRGDPDMSGGGTVEIVTLDQVVWAEPPEKEEAGSPNTVGAIALGAALDQLAKIGMEQVARHEAELTAYALEKLNGIQGVHIYGSNDPALADERLGVIPFKIDNVSHFLAAAVLGYEFGIGVRSGCFCAHPYILHLLGLSPQEAEEVKRRMLAGDRSQMPGLIRASFGLYNTREDVDTLVEALRCIVRREFLGKYTQNAATGEYLPDDWKPDFARYFSFSVYSNAPR